MRKLATILSLFLLLAVCLYGQPGVIHGSGDPRLRGPESICAGTTYIDDVSHIHYVAVSDNPCVWSTTGGPVIPAAWPFPPQAAYFAFNTPYAAPLASIIDSSGNGYNGTVAAGAAAPTKAFNGGYYSGIAFNPTTAQDQWFTIPNAATCGAQTTIVLYTPNAVNKADANGRQYLFDDAGFKRLIIQNSEPQFPYMSASTAPNMSASDPMSGNAAIAFQNAGLSGQYVFPYGTSPSGSLQQNVAVTYNCGGGVTYVGHVQGAATNATGFSGQLHFLGFWSQAMTQAQIIQATQYAIAQVRANGGPTFDKPTPNFKVAYDGDSRMANFGSNTALYTSRPYYIAGAAPSLSSFVNWGVSGQTLANILGGQPLGTSVLNTAPNQTILMDALVNDIASNTCANAAACFTTVQSTGTGYTITGAKSLYSTVISDSAFTAGQETTREGVNSSVISGALAATLNWTGVDDIAGDPIAATQVLPNNFLPSAATLSVSSGSWATGNQTIVFSGPVPGYECYAGALFSFAGVNSTINGTRKLASCSGSTVVFALVANGGSPSTGTGQFLGNGNWFLDGLHELPALNQELSTQEAASILAANGALNQCTIIQKQIPYQVPQIANQATPGLTVTVPLLQLFPGWQVCSLAINVTSAYAGVTTITMSVGDSGGTATQYLAATDLKTPGRTSAATPTFGSANGVVQLNFTTTVDNINLLTAGNVNVNIGVVVRP